MKIKHYPFLLFMSVLFASFFMMPNLANADMGVCGVASTRGYPQRTAEKFIWSGSPPTSNTCESGRLYYKDGIAFTKNEQLPEWHWYCVGSDGSSECYAPQNQGIGCGTSHMGTFAAAPTTNLCENGVKPTESGDWLRNEGWWWTCPGESCYAWKTMPAKCGELNGQSFLTTPEEYIDEENSSLDQHFCNPGNRTYFNEVVDGWEWGCDGIGGCKAYRINLIDVADFNNQSVPTSLVAGQIFTAWIEMKNVGDSTWKKSSNYKLGSMGHNFSQARIEMTNETVAPGEVARFEATFVAPSAAGTYNFQWQMVIEGINKWFGEKSNNVAIVVSASPSESESNFTYSCVNMANEDCDASKCGETIIKQRASCMKIDSNGYVAPVEVNKVECTSRGKSCADITESCICTKSGDWREVEP